MSETPLPLLYDEAPRLGWRLPLLAGALLVAGLLVTVWWLGQGENSATMSLVPDKLPPLNEVTTAYAQKIQIADLGLSRWQNFLNQEVTYLDGTLINQGQQTILALELTIEFTDQMGQLVLREMLRPIGARSSTVAAAFTPPIPPGETRNFRASFETLPRGWNYELPEVKIAGLLLKPLPE